MKIWIINNISKHDGCWHLHLSYFYCHGFSSHAVREFTLQEVLMVSRFLPIFSCLIYGKPLQGESLLSQDYCGWDRALGVPLISIFSWKEQQIHIKAVSVWCYRRIQSLCSTWSCTNIARDAPCPYKLTNKRETYLHYRCCESRCLLVHPIGWDLNTWKDNKQKQS